MSRRYRQRKDARPWESPEALRLDPEDDDPTPDDWDNWLPEVEQQQDRRASDVGNPH